MFSASLRLIGSVAGVATYVATQFSPVDAQVDCLGNGEDDIDREGRSALVCIWLVDSFRCFVPVSAGSCMQLLTVTHRASLFRIVSRCVITDLGAFVLINVYVPNAGDRKTDNGRTDLKVRFLDALKQKADVFRDAGREVQLLPCQSAKYSLHLWQLCRTLCSESCPQQVTQSTCMTLWLFCR